MAKKVTPAKKKAAKPKASPLGERIAHIVTAAVETVRQLITPKFEEVDGRLDGHDQRLDAQGGRIDEQAETLAQIKNDILPTSPDGLVKQVVRQQQSRWSALLRKKK